MMRSLCKRLSILGMLLLFAVLYIVFINLLNITCPIKSITGFSCPGCGMTRALICAVRLDFDGAFAYHKLWPAVPFFAVAVSIAFLFKKDKLSVIFAGIFSIMLFVVYLFQI